MAVVVKSLPVLMMVCVAWSVGAAAQEDDDPPPPTEKEIRKMKMKELKSFLSDRGLSCTDCYEKNEFQKFALANREVKILASKRPRKVSKEPIQLQWRKIAQEVCDEQQATEKQCKPLLAVVEGSFEQHARKVSKQLHREQSAIAKTSMGEPYFQAGSLMLGDTLKWMLKSGVTSQTKIRAKLDEPIKKYLTAVAADNVNPMYERINRKDEL